MTKFFYLGVNIHEEALDILRESGDAIVLFEREDALHVKETLDQMERSGRAYSIDRIAVESFERRTCESSVNQRERILRAVLGDPRVFLLRMRFMRLDHEGLFRGIGYFSDVIDYALTLAEIHQPEAVFCAYTPHTLESWLIARALEEFGSRVVRLIVSPLPWVLLPVQGLANAAGCNLRARSRPIRRSAVDPYLSMLRGAYSLAIPYYEKQTTSIMPSQFLRRLARWQARDVLKYLEKRAVQLEFERATSRHLSDGRYAVYFLHYQPEMNTVPEAELYADQFQAVKKLSEALPSGVRLLIKEHPSTFSRRCDRRWRPAGFYDRLISLPNTRICPMAMDTFELIDQAVFVSSIAGVCLTEALARGRPAVTFYTPRFALFREGLVIDANTHSVTELRNLFSLLTLGDRAVDEEDLRESFDQLMSSGYDGALDDTYIPQSEAQSYANSKRANCLAICDLLDGIL